MAKQKLTGKDLEGAKASGEKAKKAANQYFQETLNKLSTSIDLTNPNGLEISAAFDKYVEKVIKPIYPKGANIRQTSQVDDATGVRTVDWSFRGTNNKIEQAVQASVDNFIQSWAAQRGMLDRNGQLKPDMPPLPMQAGSISPQVFNGTKTRILNPRTAASVRAAAIRAGGDFTTDKNTGMSTWSVPDSALTPDGKQLSKSLRAEVREGDKRWLLGKVALSSLAEGASPANAEERAVAMNNRNYRVMLAKYKAMTPEQEYEVFRQRLERKGRQADYIEKYIDENPTSPLAIERAIKTQKVTNREEKAKLLAAERTPGTPEFEARIKRGLDRQIAQDKAAVAWAKKNRGKPLAKAILKRNRMKTLPGRTLEKAQAFAKTTAIGAVLGGIFGAVSIAAKFLAQLPAIASNVHKISMKGQTYNMPEQKVREYEAIEKSMRLDSGSFSSTFGGMVSTLSDVVTGGMPDTINKVAAFLSMAGRAPIDAIIKYTTGTDKDVEKLFREMFNSTLRLSFQGKDTTHRSGGLSFSAALAENAQVMEKAFPGMGSIVLGFGNAAEKNLTKIQLEEAKNSGDIFGYLVNALGKSASVSAQTATNVEHHEADRVAGVFTGIATALTNIRDGILTQILAALEPLASWLMVIAKGILANPVFKGRFDSLVSSLDAADNEKNVAALAANTIYLKTLETAVPALAAKIGYTAPEQRQAVVYRFERFNEIPGTIRTQEQFDEFFNYIGQEQSLRVVQETNKKLNYEIDKYTTGSAESLTKPGQIDRYEIGSTAVVPNVTAAQVGIQASGYIQNEAFDIALAAEELIAKNGPVSQAYILQRDAEISRGREELRKEIEEKNSYKIPFLRDKPEQIERALEIYDNAHAQEMATLQLLYSLGRDRTPAKPGETRTYLNNLSRREQREITTELTAIEAIRAQMPSLFDSVLEGTVRIEGGPSEEKREYVIRLIDTRTGREYVIRDVYNVGGGSHSLGGSNIDLTSLLESCSPTQR